MLTDEQIWQAWESAFDKPVSLDHMPTPEEILLLRIKAVLKADRKVNQTQKELNLKLQ